MTELLPLLDRRAAVQAELREIDRQIHDACREYSDANGYRAILRPEQVVTEIRRAS